MDELQSQWLILKTIDGIAQTLSSPYSIQPLRRRAQLKAKADRFAVRMDRSGGGRIFQGCLRH